VNTHTQTNPTTPSSAVGEPDRILQSLNILLSPKLCIGSSSKVASIPFVFQLETQTVSPQCFFVIPSNLKIGLGMPKASRYNELAAGFKEKLVVLYFVMASQASYISFSFYNTFTIFKRGKIIVF